MSTLRQFVEEKIRPWEKIPGGYFDPMQHAYYDLEMVRVPGTTSLLEEAGLVCYQHIPAAILAHKAEIGTAAHAAAHYYDEGDLDELTVDPEVHPYVLRDGGWTTFRRESDFRPRLIEFRMIATIEGLKVGGTLDRTGLLSRRDSLLEIKCTANKEASWGPQTAMYEMILRAVKNPRVRMDARCSFYHRVVVWLRPTSRYKLIPYEETQDYQIAKLALRAGYEKDPAKREPILAIVRQWMIAKGKVYVDPDRCAQ
jgi:hypothetical protein